MWPLQGSSRFLFRCTHLAWRKEPPVDISHGQWLNIPDFDAPTQLVQSLEHDAEHVDAVMITPERNGMVEHFGKQVSGSAFTVSGWVQPYGSRYIKPPIIYGDKWPAQIRDLLLDCFGHPSFDIFLPSHPYHGVSYTSLVANSSTHCWYRIRWACDTNNEWNQCYCKTGSGNQWEGGGRENFVNQACRGWGWVQVSIKAWYCSSASRNCWWLERQCVRLLSPCSRHHYKLCDGPGPCHTTLRHHERNRCCF